MFVKPTEGLLVRCPVSRLHLPPEGKHVENTLYWRRRISDGDVVEVAEPKAKKTVKPDEKEA